MSTYRTLGQTTEGPKPTEHGPCSQTLTGEDSLFVCWSQHTSPEIPGPPLMGLAVQCQDEKEEHLLIPYCILGRTPEQARGGLPTRTLAMEARLMLSGRTPCSASKLCYGNPKHTDHSARGASCGNGRPRH